MVLFFSKNSVQIIDNCISFTGATYKFRIAAVYSNNDNAHGPNSDKFEIKLHPEPNPEPPKNKPIIVEVTAIDYKKMHAINVKWQVSLWPGPIYTNISSLNQ